VVVIKRTSSHRKSDFKNMAAFCLSTKVIKNYVSKAKELRRVAEPFDSLAKN